MEEDAHIRAESTNLLHEDARGVPLSGGDFRERYYRS